MVRSLDIWLRFSPLPGLRTLCFAVADVSESSYQQWLELHHRASTSLQNRALKLEESYELIEKVTEKCARRVSVSDAMTSYCVPWTSLRSPESDIWWRNTLSLPRERLFFFVWLHGAFSECTRFHFLLDVCILQTGHHLKASTYI